MRVAFVTGATGFVGGHLATRLMSKGVEVHGLVRESSDTTRLASSHRFHAHLYDGSTESVCAALLAARPDIVFHVAALVRGHHEPADLSPLIRTNVELGAQLLDAMRIAGVGRIVSTGSAWQHYDGRANSPVSLYAATKQAFEAILQYYVEACRLRAVTLVLFDTYGPDDPRDKLFPLLRRAAMTGQPLRMTPGEQLIDLVYIDDVVDAYLAAAERLCGERPLGRERYAVSSGSLIGLRDLVQLFARITEQPVAVEWGARPYRDREPMIPWRGGVGLPDWAPRVALEEGLRRMMAEGAP